VVVHLWAASSAPDTDFVARLCDVFPNGRSVLVTDGIVRARYRDFCRGAPPSLIEPERPYEYVIDLWATSNVFRAGHRIRLDVTSSCFPRWDRNPNTGQEPFTGTELQIARQRVLHDPEHPSRVVLPVILA
jgi:putative CocE/NonD family hydrolase